MITFEEARKIAKEHNKTVNCCLVYKDGYRFLFDNGIDKVGTRGFVVLKKRGNILHFLEFASRYDLHGKHRRIELDRRFLNELKHRKKQNNPALSGNYSC